jgi:hypothetical protein
MVLSGTCTVIADTDRLLWDLDTSMIIRDWMGERVHIKNLNLNQHPCVAALDPNTLFAHTITQQATLPTCNYQAYDISFTIFWHNKVEHCLRRWIRRHRKRKAMRAIRTIEMAVLEWIYKPGGKGFHKACHNFKITNYRSSLP